ncbi:flagellar assembly peptidoglycan hydrolase FlgJ [Vibrio sp.]|nr:flagellar assembly peptidoglycan hydrolase FlgJ [Vibrio sp.]
MINNGNDIGFVHDIASLDTLRRNATTGSAEDEKAALTAAAKQFEAIFTSMLFKSMRSSNEAFESDLMSSKDEKFFTQMLDEQMASNLSQSGSLGLADMIVAQLSSEQRQGIVSEDIVSEDISSENIGSRGMVSGNVASEDIVEAPKELRADNFVNMMERVNKRNALSETTSPSVIRDAENQKRGSHTAVPPSLALEKQAESTKVSAMKFSSPDEFVKGLTPYAEKAASMLGIDSTLLLAQAALETGWGQKVIKNAGQQSHNLFNIKADPSWQGQSIAKQTLEYHDNVPVQQKAAFRSYESYQESFEDYINFLNSNPRYSETLAGNKESKDFIQNLHQAGYATDPDYASKVLSVQKRIQSMQNE